MAMQYSVTGKQMDVGDALRQHIEAQLGAQVGKYFGGGIEAHAVMSREKHLFCCDLSVHIGRNILMQASEKDPDAHQAADKAIDRIAKRMRRHKRRLRQHHVNGVEHRVQEAQYAILAAEPEPEAAADDSGIDPHGSPTVVAEMTTNIATLTVGEAVMRLDLTDQPALMFRNSAHGGLNVIYRRRDGHIGWIDPQEGSAGAASV